MKLKQRQGFLHEMRKNSSYYIMFLPAAIFVFIFSYCTIPGALIAFKNYNFFKGFFASPWVGFQNFKFFFTSGSAWLVTRNTFIYNLVFLALSQVVSIFFSILIAEMSGKVFKRVSQTFLLLPYFISWVLVSELVYNFISYNDGLVNNFLKIFGAAPVDFYSNPEYWYFFLPLLYIWKSIGYSSVLYLAAIMSNDRECYESAEIDGANMFQRIFHIVLPSLKPTVIILILLGLGTIMRGQFDMFYQLIGTNGNLLNGTDIIDTFVFRSLIGIRDFGMASSAGLYQSVLCFVIVLASNAVIRKVDPDYALF